MPPDPAASGLFTIPPWVPFVDALAEGVLDEFRDDHTARAGLTIFLPTRRACRALSEAFLRRTNGAPVLLPRLRALGEADEDEIEIASFDGGGSSALSLPPAIGDTRRLLLLAQAIMKLPIPPPPEQAAWLARDLAVLLDHVQTERLSFDALGGLVPDDLAAHWQTTLDFLSVLTKVWPGLLEAEQAMDPAARRNELLEAEAELWSAPEPPATHAGPVIAAGSTGSVPATADLLRAIAGIERGRVILPGLDTGMEPAIWENLDAAHPQYGMKRLLEHLGADRGDVEIWAGAEILALERRGPEPAPERRARFLTEVLRPAETTDGWDADRLAEADFAPGLANVSRVDCPDPHAEAGVIALRLREALATDAKTAALITPDRQLARRVAAELRRWDIEIDDSAGTPLSLTPPGSFLRLTALLIAEDFAPVETLAALKHPLAGGGQEIATFRRRVRALEMFALHGPRPAPGIDGLRQAVEASAREGEEEWERKRRKNVLRWLDGLATLSAEVVDLARTDAAPLDRLLETHFRFAEALAATDDAPGHERLWNTDAGEQAAAFANDVIRSAENFPDVSIRQYPALLDALMAGRMVRPRYGLHPRLNIWGPLEARLQNADLVILGGLNEGTWPRPPEADPWMSREMRKKFGLPDPERRIGLSAHDFVQAMGADEVILTRAQKVDGAPTVPSRWLLRMEAVLSAVNPDNRDKHLEALRLGQDDALHWQHMLDQPKTISPVERPGPRPPVEARPDKLSVTGVEMWRRNPYGVYARYILGLRKIDPLDADPGAADYGSVIHDALDAFVRDWPEALPDDPLAALLEAGEESFGALMARPGVRAFWWPRYQRIAEWVAAQEIERRANGIRASLSEQKGKLEVGGFTVTARADRIDLYDDGHREIIDYKTGAPPKVGDVVDGWAPQLPLEGLIAREGGFEDVPRSNGTAKLSYWKLSGGDPAGEIRAAGYAKDKDHDKLIADAETGLRKLIETFADPNTPYYATPHPAGAPRFDDYEHLARTREWQAGGSGDGDGDGGE